MATVWNAMWRSLMWPLRNRRPEAQNLFRYFATEEPRLATVAELHPGTPHADPEQHARADISA